MLESDIESIYSSFPLPYLTNKDGGWYQEYSGQMQDDQGRPEDKYIYSFSDKKAKYKMDVEIAVKCSGPASCFMFPRKF